jgi:hydrogenase nickel incorporation protein HypB
MKIIDLKKEVLEKNQDQARLNRERLTSRGIFSFNVISSPGSGKTTLLERTLAALKDEIPLAVVEGDIQTANDAERIAVYGVPVVQINTGGLCHLDAAMIARSFSEFDLDALRLLIIENVGNLVCPSSYDLGEDLKVTVISVTEGDDKPLKYPGIIRRSGVLVINKIDLLAHCDFSLEAVRRNALSVNPSLEIFEVSCRSGEGLGAWFDWIRARAGRKTA